MYKETKNSKEVKIFSEANSLMTDRSEGDKWYIKTEEGKKYFDERSIEVSMKRKALKQIPKEEFNKQNNKEAKVVQFKMLLRDGKTRYRGKLKNVLWAYCGCLWINLRRIMLYSMKNIKENIKKAKDIINNLTFNENTLNILTFYKKMTFRSRLIYLITITLGIYGGIEFLYNFSDILLAAIIIPNMIGLLILSDEVKDLKINFSIIQNIIIHQNNIYLLN